MPHVSGIDDAPGVMIGVWYLCIYAGVTVSTITVFSNEPGPVIVTRRTGKLATSSSIEVSANAADEPP